MIIIITKAVFILTGYPLIQIQKAICSIVYVTTEPKNVFTNLKLTAYIGAYYHLRKNLFSLTWEKAGF